jgi:hypothetical protein
MRSLRYMPNHAELVQYEPRQMEHHASCIKLTYAAFDNYRFLTQELR